MPIECRVDQFRITIGGDIHTGWLPANASTPLPTPARDVEMNLTIESDGAGYLLIVESAEEDVFGDSWHETLQDAKDAAIKKYGVPFSAWQPVV